MQEGEPETNSTNNIKQQTSQPNLNSDLLKTTTPEVADEPDYEWNSGSPLIAEAFEKQAKDNEEELAAQKWAQEIDDVAQSPKV
jgi:hypothetical protein